MGYCPFVYRGSVNDALYLPVPLDARNVSIASRISAVEAPLLDGTLAVATVKDKAAYTLSGLFCVGNPQNGNDPMNGADAIYERMAKMTTFFLRQSSLAFTLVISSVNKKVLYDDVLFEYPPVGVNEIYTGCIAQSLSFSHSIESPKAHFTYSLNLLIPKRSSP